MMNMFLHLLQCSPYKYFLFLWEWEGRLLFTASLEGFPIETPTNGTHDVRLQDLSYYLGKSSFIVYDATDLDSAVEGPGDAIS